MNRIDARFLIKMRREGGSVGLAIGRLAIFVMGIVDWIKYGSGFVHELVTWAGLLAGLLLLGTFLITVH